jgi:hypothetical protein
MGVESLLAPFMRQADLCKLPCRSSHLARPGRAAGRVESVLLSAHVAAWSGCDRDLFVFVGEELVILFLASAAGDSLWSAAGTGKPVVDYRSSGVSFTASATAGWRRPAPSARRRAPRSRRWRGSAAGSLPGAGRPDRSSRSGRGCAWCASARSCARCARAPRPRTPTLQRRGRARGQRATGPW